MERCKTLINKLKEQAEANADPSVMIITVQMLHTELAKLAAEHPEQQTSKSVSVVLPGYRKPVEAYIPDRSTPLHETVPVVTARQYPEPLIEPVSASENIPAPEIKEKSVANVPEKEVISLPEGIIFPVADQPGNKEFWVLDPILATPTLAHQDEIKELNEKIGKMSGESLNDRLKTSRTEISSFLTDTPVRELKKAIGINDRFLFINELFRGDVDMYERSIKTINNFRILPEAEYWIERELKIKLAWDNATEAAMLFYQLVKRRFS